MKRVIVTGASDGLGFEISKQLIAKGVEVIGISRRKPELELIHISADLTKEAEIEAAVEKIKKDFPKFDALINCAGVLNIQPIEELKLEEIEATFKVNVFAPMKLVSGLIKQIKANGSDIVNVGSSVGFKAYKNQGAYGASKWALRGFSENARLELSGTKCRVIGFNPGGFKSKLFEKATGKKAELSSYMDPSYLAELLIKILELPKDMEVSDIIISRK